MKMKSKSQMVYDHIEKLVISGEIKPGMRLPSEAKLCEQLNVSRVSVRAGIEKLSAIGLVTKKKGGGTYVNKPSPDNYLSVFTPVLLHNTDFVELLEVRRALDSIAVQLCAQNITESGIRKLETVVREMEMLQEGDDFFGADKRFHFLVSKYSKNRFLHNIHIIIWEVIQKSLRENYNRIMTPTRIMAHRKIFDAIVHKDDALASFFTVRHLEDVIDVFACEYNLASATEARRKRP